MSDRIRIVMLSGSYQYDSEDSLNVTRDYLVARLPVSVEILQWADEQDEVDLSPIDEADVLLVFARRLLTDGADLERLRKYCADGRPVVGLRTASHAFQNWPEFDGQVLGGNYQGHYEAGRVTQVEVAPGAEGHPLLEGTIPFQAFGSLYRNDPLPAGSQVLLTGWDGSHREPVAWTRDRGGSRAFCASLGCQRDFWEYDFLRLIENAVMWVSGPD
ncbi:ThuA domain-containing protein [Candidatus Latescibacterota bacterium]